WRGGTALESVPARARWNTCQRADGRLALGNRCPRVHVKTRNVRGELTRRQLAQVNRYGGLPYWLGLDFHRARPISRLIGKDIAIRYVVTDVGRPLAITILTGYGTPPARLGGVELMRFHAMGEVSVVADRPL